MQYNRFFGILALSIILSLLMLALPATPALAQSITLTPAYGPVGAVITITGSGFASGASGFVWLDSDGMGDVDFDESQHSVTTSAGNIPSGITLTVPTLPVGSYFVYADIDASGGDGTPEEVAVFTITSRSITISPTSGYVGDTATISGTGFAVSAGITILFDSTSMQTVTTTISGAFSGVTFTIPDSAKGSHTVKAQDISNPANYATTTFTVLPKVTVTPTSGGVGDTVTINGTGFAVSAGIIAYLGTNIIGNTITNTTGNFTITNFAIPLVSRGDYTVKAQDISNPANYATTTFTVGQKITITPTSGVPGTTVTVTGTGFSANSAITIKFNGDVVATTPASVTTYTIGSFPSVSFVVPAIVAGTYLVEASDGTNSTSANFVSTTDVTTSQTTSETKPGHVGMKLTITGSGFTPNATATIFYSTNPQIMDTVDTDASGNFTTEVTIPASAAGVHYITVVDDTADITVKQFTFYMESEAPSVPLLLLPTMGTKLEDWRFDWGDAEDDSEPITYDLQIASDDNFNNILVEKSGLTKSGYTLLEGERLESTDKEAPYHWRVRAVDAAANTSDWTSSRTFYVGSSWVLYLLIGVGVFFAFFLGFVIGRKSKRRYY